MAAASAMQLRVIVTRTTVDLIFASLAAIVALEAKAALWPATARNGPQREVAIGTATRTLAMHKEEARRTS